MDLLHHIIHLSSSHWFFSLILSSHWSMCQFPSGSIKNISKIPWLALEASLWFENRASATAEACNTLGRCIFKCPVLPRQRESTTVASKSTRALHSPRQNTCETDSPNARGIPQCSPVACHSTNTSQADASNARAASFHSPVALLLAEHLWAVNDNARAATFHSGVGLFLLDSFASILHQSPCHCVHPAIGVYCSPFPIFGMLQFSPP